MGQGAALGVSGVVHQYPGGDDRRVQVGAAEPLEVLHAELVTQHPMGALVVEQPVALTTQAAAFAKRRRQLGTFRYQQLRRVQAGQLRQHLCLAFHLEHAEAAAGDLEPGQADALALGRDRHQQVIAAGVEQGFVVEGAGGDDTHHLAFHRSLGGGRVADLFTDRHRLAGADQACQVALGAVIGNAGHGNRLAGGLPALGQGNVEGRGGALGVLVEQLVEVPHAVEQQHLGVLALDPQVLGHHRRMAGGAGLGHVVHGISKRC